MKAELIAVEPKREDLRKKVIRLNDGRFVGNIEPVEEDGKVFYTALITARECEPDRFLSIHPGAGRGATPEEAVRKAIKYSIESSRQTIEWMRNLEAEIFGGAGEDCCERAQSPAAHEDSALSAKDALAEEVPA